MRAPFRILVAEDVTELRHAFVTMLRDEGYEVLEAGDGREALEIIEHPDGIDLIVTDINMPAFSGFEVAEHARAKHPAVPVVFVTGRPEQVAGHFIADPVLCLPKPVRLNALAGAVIELLRLVPD